MGQPRILHVIPSVGPVRGGPAIAIRTFTRELSQAGLDVHVASTDDNGPGRLDVALETPVHEDGGTFWFFRRQARFYTFSRPLRRWLMENIAHYDLVHIHGLFSYSSVAAGFTARRMRVPYVVRPAGCLNRWGIQNRRPWLKRMSFQLLERPILDGAGAVQYTSDGEHRQAEELGAIYPSAIIPPPVDVVSFRQLPAKGWLAQRRPEWAGRRILLFLSRLHRVKGLDLLLAAFEKIRRKMPDVALIVAGDGESQFVDTVHAQAATLGLEDHVLWAGFLHDAAKKAAMAEADLFVLPSYSENFGIAVVEAMAAGLPVLISDQVGIHNEISTADAGLVVPCAVDRLDEAMQKLVADVALRKRLGANARKLAWDRFSSQSTTRALLELYQGILIRHTQSRSNGNLS